MQPVSLRGRDTFIGQLSCAASNQLAESRLDLILLRVDVEFTFDSLRSPRLSQVFIVKSIFDFLTSLSLPQTFICDVQFELPIRNLQLAIQFLKQGYIVILPGRVNFLLELVYGHLKFIPFWI